MKAALLTDIQSIEVRDVPEPEIAGRNDVKLAVHTVGVCGSDMHYYRTGRIGDQVVEFPFTVGHELSATVLDTGADVTSICAGDRVAVDPLICCGKCDQCLAGREHTCRDQAFMGVPGQLDGALSERVVMPDYCCHKIPDEMTMDQAALVEPFSIGMYAQRLAGDVQGKTAAVLGAGPIGLSVLLSLIAAGARKVYMTDIRDNRTELARRLGANWTASPRVQDIVRAIRKDTPEGADIAYECAGEQETADQCLELVKPGGTVLIVGIPELDRLSFDMNYMRRGEIRIQNVRRQNKCVQPAIELIASAQADAAAMITHHYTLDQTFEAFEVVSDYRDNVVKAMIHVAD